MAKVLLIEDEEDLLLLIQMQLRVAGVESETASSLDEARQKLAGENFDAILLDLLLGEESGWTLARELARRPERTPAVIVISAYAAADTRERARAAGCEWLPKPFSLEELHAVLARTVPGPISRGRRPSASQ